MLRNQSPIETNPLVVTDVATPEPKPDEVLIRVKACGLCRTDLHVIEGDLAPQKMPIIPGHQVVGRIDRLGSGLDPNTSGLKPGDRVGVAWLHKTCGICRFCRRNMENLCENPQFTGWTVDGGFAEYVVAPAAFVYLLPDGYSDLQAAPLLCAGIIGYRALEKTDLHTRSNGSEKPRLGIYGFGAAGHVVIQLAQARGIDVYVFTRDRDQHQKLAERLEARWVGDVQAKPPEKLDASIIFAPAGELIPAALDALDRGGRLILGGIHMTAVPPLSYAQLYQEKCIQSVANNTREDGVGFLQEAARISLHTHTEVFDLKEANQALNALKNKALSGAGVLLVE